MPIPQTIPAAAPPLPPFTFPADARRIAPLVYQALRLANRAVREDIETECPKVCTGDGRIWWDTRPMTDPREHSPAVLDMTNDALKYAIESGLVRLHPMQPYLVTFADEVRHG